jgi:hypothetical protein
MSKLEQWSDSRPPRKGEVAAITLDTTARSYALAGLTIAGHKPDAANTKTMFVYLQLHAETADCFFVLSSSNTVTLDKTAAVAAGGTLAFTNTHGARIPAGSTIGVRINRAIDTYLHVQGSAAGILRISATSETE